MDSPTNQAMTRSTTLHPTQPYDFTTVLEFLTNRGVSDRFDRIDDDHTHLARPLFLEGRPYLVYMQATGTAEIELTLQADDRADDPPTDAALDAAREWANRRFFLDVDMHAVREVLNVDEFGEELSVRFWPFRPANHGDAWDALLSTICSNGVYSGLGNQLQDALREDYGPAAQFDDQPFYFYPGPEALAMVPPAELKAKKFSRQKAGFFPELSARILDEPETYDFDRLRELPGTEAVKILKTLPGVGQWTAQYVTLRGLGHRDVFIDEDILRHEVATAHNRGEKLGKRDFVKLTEAYAPYRGIACYYTYMAVFSA